MIRIELTSLVHLEDVHAMKLHRIEEDRLYLEQHYQGDRWFSHNCKGKY
jgi:hypothetical protein